jgi:FtsP/CotA-like multicopper oxidase with cupredoxin domain
MADPERFGTPVRHNAMDGVPGLTQEAVQPGESYDYDFAAPDAGSFWYHAHNKSWDQVARGLYGPLIVDEPDEVFDRAHDLTLMLDDWRLNREGVLDVESLGSMMDWSHAGRLGNWMTVNGEYPREYGLNAGETYRLRLINAANARVLEIDPAKFGAAIAALDGQPLAVPADAGKGTLLLGPAQRIDLLVTPEAGKDFALFDVAGGESYPLVGFKVAGSAGSAMMNTPRLPPNALPEPDLANARRVPLHMTGGAMGGFSGLVYKGKELGREDIRRTKQMWGMNGVANLGEKPFFSATRGETIVLETVNDTAFNHAMHLHGHHFRVIERSEAHPVKGEPWRDTFMVGPRQRVKVAFVADNPGKWLLHCHMLEHAAAGMNSWFEVT